CPIFQARSMHKYDATDYRHIDQTLGDPGEPAREFATLDSETEDPATWGWTAADRYFVDVLLPEAKKRGLRVSSDGVWNDVGTGGGWMGRRTSGRSSGRSGAGL